MADLIDRQAAIDALGEKPLAWTEGEYELGLQNQWQSDVDALKELPSAQPDGIEAAKRLNDLIFDINPAEICAQIEADNLKNSCEIIQPEMKMAMVQLPCWAERRTDE